MKKTINWPLAKELYVTDPTATHASVAQQMGCGEQAVKNRAAKEGWTEARELYQYEVSTKTREVAAFDLAEVRARHVSLSKVLQNAGLTVLSNLRKEEFAKLTPRDALAFITAATELERKSLGMDTLDIDLQGIGDVTKLSNEELDSLITRIEQAMGKPKQRGLGKN